LAVDKQRSLPIAGQRRERADAAANRVRILEATRLVLVERGAEGITIDAVAARAGVGKGTVFRRFGDRSGLFQALLDEQLRVFQDAFMFGAPPLGPGAPPKERLAAFLEGLLELPIAPDACVADAPPLDVAVARVESPRGATVCALERSGDRVARLHLRTGSYSNWPVLARVAQGNLLPDFPLINKSFELCYACADR